MKKSNKGIFLLAFLMALVGAGALFVYFSRLEQPKVAEVRTVPVVIAIADIPARTAITEEMVNVIQIPETGIIGTPLSTTEEVIGKFSKDVIYLNQQIHPNAISEEINNDMSAKLTGNNRAMTITVNNDTGVDGFLKPGDFVDVILYMPQGSDQGRISRPDITKLFLQKVEILGVNKTMYRNNTSPTQGAAEASSFSVTLSIPIMDVELFALAKMVGGIELALRPLEEDYLYVTEGAIWQELLLNDMNQMKDTAPEYGIIGEEPALVQPGQYEYDQYVYYVVEFGDTLKSISLKFYNDENLYLLIQQVNRIVDPNMILTGTGIKIPVLKERGDGSGN